MHTRSEIKAGAVILAALLLGCVILAAAGRWSSFFEKKQTLHILFTDVQGLKVKDPVQVMGLQLGKVTAIAVTHFNDAGGRRTPALEVTASMAYPEAFSKDSMISVNRTLTGNTILLIEPGQAAEKIATGEKVMGTAAVSMTELAVKAGSIAGRIDDFVAVMADREMAVSARTAVANLKETSELARSVMASLNRSIPAAERGFVNSVKNLEQVSNTVNTALLDGKGNIAETIVNFHSASQSLARVGDNADRVLAKSRDPLIQMFSNAEKTSANLKSATRQLRWQPWLLLKKPDKASERERGLYNASLDFSEGAASLNASVKELAALTDLPGQKEGKSAIDAEKLKNLARQANENMVKSAALEQQLWKQMTEK